LFKVLSGNDVIVSCHEVGIDNVCIGETEDEIVKNAARQSMKGYDKAEEYMGQMKKKIIALIHNSGSTDTTTALRQTTELG
jgi:hypothetical protein